MSSLVAQMVKNLPAVQETQVQSLGLEDPLEKGKATHPSILNFIAASTFHSDFGSQENKICHCFHFFPFYMCMKGKVLVAQFCPTLGYKLFNVSLCVFVFFMDFMYLSFICLLCVCVYILLYVYTYINISVFVNWK